jgi:hypothetical protein
VLVAVSGDGLGACSFYCDGDLSMKEKLKAWFAFGDGLYDPPPGLFVVAVVVAIVLAVAS